MNVMRAILDPREYAQIYAALDVRHPRFGLLWSVGCESGLRISDVLSLQVKHVKSSFVVTERKTGKSRKIDLTSEMLVKINYYVSRFGLSESDFLFYSASTRTDKPMSRQWADIIISRTAKNLGLESVGTHSMRKTYACNLYRLYGRVESVRRAMRHKSVETTKAYLRDILETQPGVYQLTAAPSRDERPPLTVRRFFDWLRLWVRRIISRRG
jgi:integrase